MRTELSLKNLKNKLFYLHYRTADGKYEKRELKWMNIFGIFITHVAALYGAYIFWEVTFWTKVFSLFYGYLGGLGVTAGVHRLWSHRSYKAKLPLRIILAIFFSISGQNTIPQWVLDHRVHHKYSETDADPHNAARGFFFAHVGWLMQHKSKAVKEKGKLMDMSDVLEDPVVQFHTRHFAKLKIFFAFLLPGIIPIYFWGETVTGSIFVSVFLRYILALNSTWLVNSAAHIWGDKPYDTRIGPAENKTVAYLAIGEGWHNYHHVFPWDYKASEFRASPNFTTKFLNFFAWIGWAYDLKSPSPELVNKIAEKYGDGSRQPFEVLPNSKVVNLSD